MKIKKTANETNNIRKNIRSSPSEVFLGKGVLKIYSKFTGKHPYQNVISIKLKCKIIFQHVRSLVNLLHIFRTPLPKNTSRGLLLKYDNC